ncbi:MAG: hypothetical protein J2P17_27015 [Mycobacterium sp.]|nr:hypothetical protein [Mycobacterium sp.]
MSRFIRGAALLSGAALLGASGVAAPANAAGAAALVTCTSGSLSLLVSGGAVIGNGTVSGCTGPSGVTSANIAVRGTRTVNTLTQLVLNSSDAFFWNNGASTLVTTVRTITGASTVADAGTGTTTSGQFHPAAEAEAAKGTRSNNSTGQTIRLTFTNLTLS